MGKFKEIKCLFPLIVCLCVTLCFGIRQFHLGIIQVNMPENKPTESVKVKRFLECIYSCLLSPKCASVCFNRTNDVCYVYESPTSGTLDNHGTIRAANFRKAPGEDPAQKSSLPRHMLVLKRGEMTWHEAEASCTRDIHNGILQTIDSDIKQRRATELANKSGLEYIAIGVYRDKLTWKTTQMKNLNYTAWARGEPSVMGWFGVLSKKNGYKWEAIARKVNGRLCETRN